MKNALRGILGVAVMTAVVSPAMGITAYADAGGEGTPRTAAADAVVPSAAACPAPFPVDQVTDDMTGWGLTVSKGTTPDRFTVKVQGVLKDGIAPDIDMILVEAESPALDKVGSIWEGMSGSPVYAEDGRLLGAVAYGFGTPSRIAGLTPASAMLDILNKPDRASTTARRESGTVKLTAALRTKLTSRGLVSAAAASGGLSRLRIPQAVSGLSERRIDAVNARLARSGSSLRLRQAASSATGAAADPAEAFPGGNFGVVESYGVVTQGEIGTTTMVCGGRAIAFGHPYFTEAAGRVRLTAVSGSVIAIITDSHSEPSKLANFGGVLGTLTQDRPAGISAVLGSGPPAIPITARSTFGGATRTDTSYVNRGENVPTTAAYDLWAGLDRVRDEGGGGSATVTWRIRGTSAGRPFDLTLSDAYADPDDAIALPGLAAGRVLAALQNNPYSAVTFTDVRATASVNETYREYKAAKVLVKSGKRWIAQNPERPIKATAGKSLKVRVTLLVDRAPAEHADLTLTVPKAAKGASGVLSIVGGMDGTAIGCDPDDPSACSDDLRAQTTSFADLIAKLRATQRNDVLVGDLELDGGSASHIKVQRKLDSVVSGDIELPVVIAR